MEYNEDKASLSSAEFVISPLVCAPTVETGSPSIASSLVAVAGYRSDGEGFAEKVTGFRAQAL